MCKEKTKKHVVLGIVLLAIMFLTTIPAVSALPLPTATLLSPADPNNVHAGDVISIQLNNIPVGPTFTYRITSNDLQTSSDTISLSGVNMPLGITPGFATTSLTTTGVAAPGVSLTVTRLSDGSLFSTTGNPITIHNNINKDSYDVSMTGTKTGTDVGIDYSIEGPVSDAGTNPSTLSFAVTNVNSGHLTVEVLDGGVSLLSQTFTISVPVTPTPVPTPVNGGSDGPSGPSAPSGPAGGPQLAPPGFSPSTATLLESDEGKTLADYSIDIDPAAGYSGSLHIPLGEKVVDINGKPVSQITITPLDTTGLPGAPVFAFECEPSGTQFTGGDVTFTITMTDAQWAAALLKAGGDTSGITVGYLDPATNTWVNVPVDVDPVTHTVTAHITHFSIYALFVKASNEVTSTSAQTYGSLVSPTPTSTVSTIVPIVTPVKTMQAPPSTTQSPGLPGLAVIGIVGFVGLFIISKKQ